MSNLRQNLKQHFWPISAILFCPCHLPLTMQFVATITAGTALGSLISAYYSPVETVLAITFSFYFVLAFLMWVVRGPKQREGQACLIDADGNRRLSGLSTAQILTWGIIGMLLVPALVTISYFTREDPVGDTIFQTALANVGLNSGFIWLLSITLVVMIPVMLVWLVWLWLAWSKTDMTDPTLDDWKYEYE